MTVVEVTLPYSSTAAGVKMALLDTSVSPLTIIAIAIGKRRVRIGSIWGFVLDLVIAIVILVIRLVIIKS